MIDENAVINIYDENDQLLKSQNMNMKGCYDTEAHYAYYINEALKLSGYVFEYDNEVLLR